MKKEKECKVCGTIFEYRRASKEYCSIGCRRAVEADVRRENFVPAKAEKKECELCGILFRPNKYTPGQPYCSPLCRHRAWRKNNRVYYSNKRREERQRNKDTYYRSNRDYKNRTRFGGNKYKVLERDNNQCVDCGKDNPRALVIHHIDFSGQTNSPNNEMDNLETLCRSCHIKKHTHVLNKI